MTLGFNINFFYILLSDSHFLSLREEDLMGSVCGRRSGEREVEEISLDGFKPRTSSARFLFVP